MDAVFVNILASVAKNEQAVAEVMPSSHSASVLVRLSFLRISTF